MKYASDHLRLQNYTSVGLDQVQRMLYSDRTDTKYVLNTALLGSMLAQLETTYAILEIEGHRIHPYRTLYFDTPDLALYHQHHNGKLRRYKIRSRKYELTGKVFNEVKCKTNRRRTEKKRIPRTTLTRELDSTFSDFIAANWDAPPKNLRLSLEVLFDRITLVDRSFSERITIDTGLTYSYGHASYSVPQLAIVELKRGKFAGHSVAGELFRGHRMSCSKYCLGITNIHRRVKSNNFKPLLRSINKITQGQALLSQGYN